MISFMRRVQQLVTSQQITLSVVTAWSLETPLLASQFAIKARAPGNSAASVSPTAYGHATFGPLVSNSAVDSHRAAYSQLAERLNLPKSMLQMIHNMYECNINVSAIKVVRVSCSRTGKANALCKFIHPDES